MSGSRIKWLVGLVIRGSGDPKLDIQRARERYLTHSEAPDAITKVESEGSK